MENPSFAQHQHQHQELVNCEDQNGTKSSKHMNVGAKIQKMAKSSHFSASFDHFRGGEGNSSKTQRNSKNSKNSNTGVKSQKTGESSHFGAKNVEKFTKWLPDLQLKRARSQSLPAAAESESPDPKGFVKKKKRQLAATVKSIARVYRRHSVQARHHQEVRQSGISVKKLKSLIFLVTFLGHATCSPTTPKLGSHVSPPLSTPFRYGNGYGQRVLRWPGTCIAATCSTEATTSSYYWLCLHGVQSISTR